MQRLGVRGREISPATSHGLLALDPRSARPCRHERKGDHLHRQRVVVVSEASVIVP
jgi:hypothetical protein